VTKGDAAHVDPDRREDPAGARAVLNHWWQVTLYVSTRGLTTSAIPYRVAFDIEFDFIDHRLQLRSSDGAARTVALEPMAGDRLLRPDHASTHHLGIKTQIQSHPNEVEPAIPFADDNTHAS